MHDSSPITISLDEARMLRLESHGLDRLSPDPDPASVVWAQCAVQAQDIRGAGLSIWARAKVTQRAIDTAINEARIIRTWLFRQTLHYVRADDIRWLLKLLAPSYLKITARHRELGLDENTLEKAMQVIRAALTGKRLMTRPELAEEFQRKKISPEGQRLPHMLAYSAFAGLICQGPPRGREPTYVLLDEWVPAAKPLSRDAALKSLAHRYLEAHGPADLKDFSWWSGLPSTDARAAWESVADKTLDVAAGEKIYLILKSRFESAGRRKTRKSSLRLLSAYDNYLLGYRDRSLVIGAANVKRINAGGGLLKPGVIVNGRVAGHWNLKIEKESAQVIVEPFEAMPEWYESLLSAEAGRLGKFLNRKTTLTLPGIKKP